ncbi:MAG: peptidoglycan-binding domain-containing protein [Ilumatobacteraceae bacterium]
MLRSTVESWCYWGAPTSLKDLAPYLLQPRTVATRRFSSWVRQELARAHCYVNSAPRPGHATLSFCVCSSAEVGMWLRRLPRPVCAEPAETLLQRLMAHHGCWAGPDDGAFTSELTAAVVALQQWLGVSCADGIVRQATWDALQLLTEQSDAATSSTSATDETSVPGDGPGVPAFEYTLFGIPLAHAVVAVPGGVVDATLSITGKVKVTFQQSVQGFTMNVNDQAWKVAAQESLDGLNVGIEIGGLGTDSPWIASTYQTQFAKTG